VRCAEGDKKVTDTFRSTTEPRARDSGYPDARGWGQVDSRFNQHLAKPPATHRESRSNVNGRAATIEMMFGLAAMRTAIGGRLPAVRWSSYNQRMDDYQGHHSSDPRRRPPAATRIPRR
jgi:hypothetical protein